MFKYQPDDIHIHFGVPDAPLTGLVALDTEWFGQDVDRLHRPHGTFACLTATNNGRDVWIVFDTEHIQPMLDRCVGTQVWHNALYDITQLRRFVPYPETKKVWDTMLVEQIMFAGWYSEFSLADLARRWCDILMDKEERKTFGESTSMSDSQIFYAAIDTVSLWEVATKQREYIDEDDLYIWQNIERPYLWTLLSTDGIPFDSDKWMERTNRYKAQAEEIDNSLPFNPRSPKQVTQFFKDVYKVNLKSTNEEALTELLAKKPYIKEAQLILESRGLTKAAGTYGEGWLPFVEDGKVFPAWRQIGTETARVAVRGKVGIQVVPHTKEYRECFRAEDGYSFVIADYSSQEPKILAHLTQDPTLLEIFNEGKDIYIEVGYRVFGERFDKKDPRRQMMKSVILGVSYGMTNTGLAAKLEITKEHADELLDKFFDAFPAVAQYVQDCAEWKSYVTSILGRKYWGNKAKFGWERNYQNSPIQMSAADTTKVAANAIRKRLGYNPCIIYVHDELVTMFPDDQLEYGMQVVKEEMERVQGILHPGIPGKVDVFVGKDWSEK